MTVPARGHLRPLATWWTSRSTTASSVEPRPRSSNTRLLRFKRPTRRRQQLLKASRRRISSRRSNVVWPRSSNATCSSRQRCSRCRPGRRLPTTPRPHRPGPYHRCRRSYSSWQRAAQTPPAAETNGGHIAHGSHDNHAAAHHAKTVLTRILKAQTSSASTTNTMATTCLVTRGTPPRSSAFVTGAAAGITLRTTAWCGFCRASPGGAKRTSTSCHQRGNSRISARSYGRPYTGSTNCCAAPTSCRRNLSRSCAPAAATSAIQQKRRYGAMPRNADWCTRRRRSRRDRRFPRRSS